MAGKVRGLILRLSIGAYGLIGEVLAHVIFPIKTQLPTCAGSFFVNAWCQTGFPAIGVNPWFAYHVSVHFVLGFGVFLLILPEKVRRKMRLV